MKLQAIPTANYLDILFDNRNKAYGGYELRKNQDKRTLTAFSIVIALILTGSLYSRLVNHATPVQLSTKLPGDMIVCDIKPPITILPPKIEILPPAGQPVKTIKSTPPVIVHDNEPKPSDLPDNTALTDAVAAATTSDGTAATSGTPSITGNENENGNNNSTATVSETPAAPFSFVQEMPEFIGNFNDYLQKQLIYPNAARENGIEGQVVVQFIVNEDGRISGAKIIRGIGGGCNEEALRVVNNMPKWKPGKQNNKTVKVYYTLPIRFQLS
jgi:periplasmic protein TonB